MGIAKKSYRLSKIRIGVAQHIGYGTTFVLGHIVLFDPFDCNAAYVGHVTGSDQYKCGENDLR